MPLSFKTQGSLAIFCWFILAVSGNYQDWLDRPVVTSPPPLRIMQPAGKEVQLRCWSKSRQGPLNQECCKSHDIVWHYKRCGIGYDITPCHSSSDESWTLICGNNTKPCRSILVLNITTEGDSGLYRCSVSHRNKTSKNFKVTQTYELEVIEMKGAPPEFLQEQPSNVTVHAGEPAVFQCRIHSKVPPLFYWLRRQDEGASSNGLITYLNNTYEPMKSSGERDLSDEVYLSKLILPQSSEENNGYYICLAMNDQGFQFRGAYLTVLKNTPIESSIVDNMSSSSLPLLFLIPAALALVPLTVWACCPWKQRCRRNHLPRHSQHDPIITIEPTHHNNNPMPKHQRCNGRDFKYKPVGNVGHCSSNECQRNCNQFV